VGFVVYAVAMSVPLQILHDFLYSHGLWRYGFQPAVWGLVILSFLILSKLLAWRDKESPEAYERPGV
jgi:hypothetical protein